MVAGPLWTWQELNAALQCDRGSGPDVNGVQIDTRLVERGDLFIALPGDPGPRFNVSHRSARDGHDYVDAALQNGAVAALVHRDDDYSLPVLRVDDTLDGLWALARARRADCAAQIVGVTGSSGKTTFKGFLATAMPGMPR